MRVLADIGQTLSLKLTVRAGSTAYPALSLVCLGTSHTCVWAHVLSCSRYLKKMVMVIPTILILEINTTVIDLS